MSEQQQQEQPSKEETQNQQQQQSQPFQEQQQQKLSKYQLKKQEKQRLKKEKEQQRLQAERKHEKEQIAKDPLSYLYGDLPLQPQQNTKKQQNYTEISQISEQNIGQKLLIRSRLHYIRKGNLTFLTLRQNSHFMQAVSYKKNQESYINRFISKIPLESIIDVQGTIQPAQILSENITLKSLEIQIDSLFVVSRAYSILPFNLDDASQKIQINEDYYESIKVSMNTRLNHRILDLRIPSNQAIFKLLSQICFLFRQYLISQNFMEVHTPKITPITLQDGYQNFKLKYFNKDAYLAQSPQLYQQMCLLADFQRVFEITPVFQAIMGQTHRHLCEFTSLSLQMELKEDYTELIDLLSNLFLHIFKTLDKNFQKEIQSINQQYEFQPIKIIEPILQLSFKEAIQLLNQNGIIQDPLDSLTTETERKLGSLFKNKYGTDFFILYNQPKILKSFTTMLDPKDPNYTLSFTLFLRGEEIASGAQYNHDTTSLSQRAQECGIQPSKIKSYIDSFSYGAYPHGGCSIGLERLLFLYFDLRNIRKCSLFPRDPHRITP